MNLTYEHEGQVGPTLTLDMHNARKARLQRFADAANRYSAHRRQQDNIKQAAALERFIELNRAEAPPQPEPLPPVEGLPLQVVTIQRAVAARFDLKRVDLTGPVRLAKVVLARQIAIYLCRKMTTRSFPYLAGKFGGRDHSTLVHASKKIERLIAADEKFAAMIQSIEDEIARFDQIKAAVQG